jgi:predicted AlkP superfamily pyrophosphatase or phosphodiesterase
MSLKPLSFVLILGWVILAGVSGTPHAVASDLKSVRKVLVIGIDGCRPDALEAAETPNIDRLIKQGLYCENTDILAARGTKGDTVSGPGWSNLLTGVWPDKHGVVDNSFKGSNYKDYPHFFARVKEARPELKTASFSSWPPIAEKIVSAADTSVNAKALHAADYLKADDELSIAAAKSIREGNTDVVVCYFGQVDETGHAHGFHPTVKKYVESIERVDGYIGRLLEAVDERQKSAGDEWLILVCTDHGGSGTNHGGGREKPEIRQVFLIASGPLVKPGKTSEPTYQVDVVATAMAYLGIKLDDTWKLDGKSVLEIARVVEK